MESIYKSNSNAKLEMLGFRDRVVKLKIEGSASACNGSYLVKIKKLA